MNTTRRIVSPRYGMVVTDVTGMFVLTTQHDPQGRGDEKLVWHAFRLDGSSRGPAYTRDYLLMLDPDEFEEVVE